MKKNCLVLVVMFLGLTLLNAGDVSDHPGAVPERDDAQLALDLAAFDMKTWRLVGKYWNRPEESLEMVDDHMREHRKRVLAILKSFGAVECSLNTAGQWIIGSDDADRDRVFINEYQKKVAKIEAIKKGFVEDPQMSKVALAVLSKERSFRQSICDTIMKEDQGTSEPLESLDS